MNHSDGLPSKQTKHQLPLFADRRRQASPQSLPPHHHHNAQSRKAAKQAAPKLAGRRAAIVRFLREQGHHGATRDELSVALDVPVHCLTGPVKLLLNSGDIEKTKRTRPTRLGCSAAVLVVPTDRFTEDLG